MALENSIDQREAASRAQRVDPQAFAAELGGDLGGFEQLRYRGTRKKQDGRLQCPVESVEMPVNGIHDYRTLAQRRIGSILSKSAAAGPAQWHRRPPHFSHSPLFSNRMNNS